MSGEEAPSEVREPLPPCSGAAALPTQPCPTHLLLAAVEQRRRPALLRLEHQHACGAPRVLAAVDKHHSLVATLQGLDNLGACGASV